MLIHDITAQVGAKPPRKRVGRGRASGQGKTAARGHKGDRSRSGFKRSFVHEGGQMPLFRRLPKRGFNNANFRTRYEVVNVRQLEQAFGDGMTVGIQQLCDKGLIDHLDSKVKILGDGELTKKLVVCAHKFSKSAQQKIIGCGGSVQIVA